MSTKRDKLRVALEQYIVDTFTYIYIVKNFIDCRKWIDNRKAESDKMTNIQEKVKQNNMSVLQLKGSKNKGKDLLNLMKNNIHPGQVKRERAKLKKELEAVLKQTQSGLKELENFLDAVEKLVVTSGQVFQENTQVYYLSNGADLESVQDIITAAQNTCSVLPTFKQDNKVVFSPKLKNVEVLLFQLNLFISKVQEISDKFKDSSLKDFSLKEPVVDAEDLSEDAIEKMFSHINEISNIRTNEHFRMVMLFQDKSQSFLTEFSERRPQMLQCLSEVDACAVQLDQMNKGKKISNVVGSSVGVVSGALFIIGTALSPVTFGASLALTVTGFAMGVTSGVSSAVTTGTEIGVNRTQENGAKAAFQKLIDHMCVLQECVYGVTNRELPNLKRSSLIRGSFRLVNKILGVGEDNFPVFGMISTFKKLRSKNETEFSKHIKASATLSRSQVDSWQKICGSLQRGLEESKQNQVILRTPFYPDSE